MIRSRANPKIRRLQRLRRQRGDHALLEGPDLVAAALAAGIELELMLATPEFLAGSEGRRLQRLAPLRPLEVAPALLAELTDADAPRGLLGLARLERGGVEALPVRAGPYLYLDRIQDPGNLGALARVAEAAGARGMALAPGSAHPNHPRALRAAAGSLLRLPVALGIGMDELAAHLAPLAPVRVALAPRGGEPLWHAELPANPILLLGAEGPGLDPALERQADLRLQVPMAPPVESLNVAVAAALVLFEYRRRDAGG